MAVAVIGSVVCMARSLKMPIPLFNNQFEMVENNLGTSRLSLGERLYDHASSIS